MLKIGSVRWKGKCSRHPGYTPETDGLGGIRGGCRRCEALLEIWTCHARLVRMMREFGARQEERPRQQSGDDRRQMSLLDNWL